MKHSCVKICVKELEIEAKEKKSIDSWSKFRYVLVRYGGAVSRPFRSMLRLLSVYQLGDSPMVFTC